MEAKPCQNRASKPRRHKSSAPPAGYFVAQYPINHFYTIGLMFLSPSSIFGKIGGLLSIWLAAVVRPTYPEKTLAPHLSQAVGSYNGRVHPHVLMSFAAHGWYKRPDNGFKVRSGSSRLDKIV